jgi:NAD(P)-dependent dehydrogenase (short-subunit alcohol dehydrogenase family)
VQLIAICDETGYNRSEAWSLDLASFASIRSFADRFEKEGGGYLDIFIGNAGAWFVDYATTVDGWERSFVFLFLNRHESLLKL